MKIENTKVFNFEGAFRGMRNPLDSWDKSDSSFGIFQVEPDDDAWEIALTYLTDEERLAWEKENDPRVERIADNYQNWILEQGIFNEDNDWNGYGEYVLIGKKDLDLAQRLIKGGPEHRKFLRQIFVSFDITAPFYWWKEFDTYKVGTVANSCSTMHKLASYPITMDCFETDDFCGDLNPYDGNPLKPDITMKKIWENLIIECENLRRAYNETKDKKYWKELVRILPEGWLQKRTITLNYENLRSMYTQRKNHKLTEWHYFCDWIQTLPYAKDLITYGIE